MNHRIMSAIALLIAVPQIGCGGSDQPTAPAGPEKPAARIAARNPKIPVEVSYPIIKEEDEYLDVSKKRMVDVRLNMKVSPEVLREIALEVKSKETRQYDMTFISIYLPESGLGVDESPWATCHFIPTLEVMIYGSTKEAEAALKNKVITTPGKRIGAWFVEVQTPGHIHILYEDEGKVIHSFNGLVGDPLNAEVVEQPSTEGRRFKDPDSSTVYDIDQAGNLRIYSGSMSKPFAAGRPLK